MLLETVCLMCTTTLFTLYLSVEGTDNGTIVIENTTNNFSVDCLRLRIGQYRCPHPEIDPQTQQPKGCTKDNTAKVLCTLAEGLVCNGSNTNTFYLEAPCKFTNGKSFEVALLLSIFLGTFGVDRFYLGYPAIGLVKLCTLGFLFLGQLVDIILIATQVVGPADGSNYIINYFGQGITVLRTDNETYKVPREDW